MVPGAIPLGGNAMKRRCEECEQDVELDLTGTKLRNHRRRVNGRRAGWCDGSGADAK